MSNTLAPFSQSKSINDSYKKYYINQSRRNRMNHIDSHIEEMIQNREIEATSMSDFICNAKEAAYEALFKPKEVVVEIKEKQKIENEDLIPNLLDYHIRKINGKYFSDIFLSYLNKGRYSPEQLANIFISVIVLYVEFTQSVGFNEFIMMIAQGGNLKSIRDWKCHTKAIANLKEKIVEKLSNVNDEVVDKIRYLSDPKYRKAVNPEEYKDAIRRSESTSRIYLDKIEKPYKEEYKAAKVPYIPLSAPLYDESEEYEEIIDEKPKKYSPRLENEKWEDSAVQIDDVKGKTFIDENGDECEYVD